MFKSAILPALVTQPASRAARVWCVVRSLDNPINGGTGSGLVKISLTELSFWLQRSDRSTWRYLREALNEKYFHSCHCENGQLRIEYRGLKPLAKLLGLESLGAIGEFPLEEIQHAKARAADIQAEKLQAQSFFKMKEEFGRFARGARKASELLSNRPPSARVSGGVFIARGQRLIYLEPHWRPFGGSQKRIADELGVSVRTVQYRLSNRWRESRELATIEKAQTAHQVFEECPKAFLQDFLALEEKSEQRYVFLGSKLFKVGCNLYDTGVVLRCQRRQQAYYKIENSQVVLHGNYTLDSIEFQEAQEPSQTAQATRL